MQIWALCKTSIRRFKFETILKGCLDSIPSPSPTVEIQNMGGKICFSWKNKKENFPAKNLNFQSRWRWWHSIQAIFLNLFYFTKKPFGTWQFWRNWYFGQFQHPKIEVFFRIAQILIVSVSLAWCFFWDNEKK